MSFQVFDPFYSYYVFLFFTDGLLFTRPRFRIRLLSFSETLNVVSVFVSLEIMYL